MLKGQKLIYGFNDKKHVIMYIYRKMGIIIRW